MFQAKQEKQQRIRPFSARNKNKRITGLLWTVTMINLAKTQGTQPHLNHINWSQDNCEFFASNYEKLQHEISSSKVSFLPYNQIFYKVCIEASKWELITLNIDVEAHLRICEKFTKILQFFHPRDQKFRAAKIAAQSATIATSRFLTHVSQNLTEHQANDINSWRNKRTQCRPIPKEKFQELTETQTAQQRQKTATTLN